MTPFLNNQISLAARGALAAIMASGAATITAGQVQSLGAGRDQAYRILIELRGAGYLTRTQHGYTLNPELLESRNQGTLSLTGELLSELLESRNQGTLMRASIDHSSPGELPSELLDSSNSEGEMRAVHRVNHPQSYLNPGIQENQEESRHRLHVHDHDLDKKEDVVENFDFLDSSNSDAGEPDTLSLIADAATNEASSAAPAPKKPRNPPAPSEVKALYPALFDLTKTPKKGKRAMGLYQVAKNLYHEFQPSPEQIAAFWDWFRAFSPAARAAARDKRPVNAPLPRQVYEGWPEFLIWWKSKQDAAKREAERRAAQPAADEVKAQRKAGYEAWLRLSQWKEPAPQPAAD